MHVHVQDMLLWIAERYRVVDRCRQTGRRDKQNRKEEKLAQSDRRYQAGTPL